MVLVPLLALGFGVDIRYAIGASLISVIATSSGAAAAYVKEGYLRVGMFLEIATTLGALAGAFLAARVPTFWIAVIFGVVLIHSAYLSSRTPGTEAEGGASDAWARRLRLDGSYPTPSGPRAYHVRAVPAGFGLMVVAGTLSGLLGKAEAQRIARALSLPPVTTLDDYLLAQEVLIDLLGPDLLDYRVGKVSDTAAEVHVERCFAFDNAVRAGVAGEYECGIFARVTGWLDGLGLAYEAPPLGKCLKAQGRQCVYTISLAGRAGE